MTHPFTPTYISMAKAAEEIQAMRKHSPPENPKHSDYQLGDWFIEHIADQVVCLGDSFMYDDGGICQAEYSGEEEHPQAWLPRLDQLLAMLGTPADLLKFTKTGDLWFDAKADWHELVLEMVLWEKFGKRWDSQEGKWMTE